MNPAQLIDQQIADLGDWRGEILAHFRTLIHAAAPNITEEWKWGTAVYTQKGLICAASAFGSTPIKRGGVAERLAKSGV